MDVERVKPQPEGAVYVVNLVSGDKVAASMTFPEPVNSLAFIPDGKTLVAGIGGLGIDPKDSWPSGYGSIGPSSGTIAFYDTENWRKTGELKLPGAVLFVAVSPNGKLLAAMSSKADSQMGTEVTLWSLPDRAKRASFELDGYSLTPSGTRRPVRSLAFSPDSRLLAAMESQWSREDPPGHLIYDPARVVIWDLKAMKEVKSFAAGPSPGTSVTFSGDGQRLFAGVEQGITIWDTRTWTRERTDVCNGALAPLFDDQPYYFYPAWGYGTRCGIIRCLGTVKEKRDNEETVAQFTSPAGRGERHGGNVFAIAVSRDKKLVAVGGNCDEVGVWKMPELPRVAKRPGEGSNRGTGALIDEKSGPCQ